MALEVRRIVTGHDANGKAIIKTDERLPAVSRLGRPHIAGCEIWSTDRMPADNSEAADAAQRKGFVTRYNYVGTGQGTVVRITEFAPGAPKFMHRTETVDYALLLSGECDLELDSGEVAHLKPGDVVVQRGTMHAWVNNGPAPCVFAFILIDAEPATVAGGPGAADAFPGTLSRPPYARNRARHRAACSWARTRRAMRAPSAGAISPRAMATRTVVSTCRQSSTVCTDARSIPRRAAGSMEASGGGKSCAARGRNK
jgi:quercetin dioxygenase-like cupin family protein